MADIIITPGSSLMAFTSSLNFKETLTQEASGSLTLLGSGSTGRTDIFTVNGNNGTLFSVSDDLSNSLFSVNTIAGLPVIEAFADNTVVMGQYGQNVLVITGSRVGIRTSSPSYKLHVNTTSTIEDVIGITNGTQTLTLGVNNSAGGSYLFENGSNALRFGTSGTERMRIDSSGKVGIGTTTPDYPLHVVAQAFIGDDAVSQGLAFEGSSNSYINFRASSGPTAQITCGNTSNLFLDAFYSRAIEFAIDSVTKMEVSPNGNVGIQTAGTVDPSAVLELKSNTQGFLPPRMTEAERDSISGPAAGLIIFNTDSLELNVFNGGGWKRVQYI